MRSIVKGKSTMMMNHEDLITTNRNSFIIPGQWPAESLQDTSLGDVLDNVQEDMKELVAETLEGDDEPEQATGWRSWGVVQFLQIDHVIDAIQAAPGFIAGAVAIAADAIGQVFESAGDESHEEVTRTIIACVYHLGKQDLSCKTIRNTDIMPKMWNDSNIM
jgi:hypothetical protein